MNVLGELLWVFGWCVVIGWNISLFWEIANEMYKHIGSERLEKLYVWGWIMIALGWLIK